MKNIFIGSLFAFLLAIPFGVFASSTSFSPSTISVTPGQSFSVSLVVTPAEAAVYTAKIALSYPADLLSVSSFTFASGWLPLSQPGYDSVDNIQGSLIKTAGYSGGLTATKVFGTITFTAKGSGTATIVPTGGTQILDANNTNTFSLGGRATVSVERPVPLPVVTVPAQQPVTNTSNPSRTPLTPVKKPVAKTAVSVSASTQVSVPVTMTVADVFSESGTTSDATTSQNAITASAVSSSGTKQTSLYAGAIALLAAFGLGFLIGAKRRLV
jgi:hypothetical protein